MVANDEALDGSVEMAGLLKTDPQRTENPRVPYMESASQLAGSRFSMLGSIDSLRLRLILAG
jgi:hypothetical protein